MSSEFKNYASLIRVNDKEKGLLTIKPRFALKGLHEETGTRTRPGIVIYTLKLTFADNKYDYRIEKINLKQNSYFGIEKWYDTEGQYYKKDYVEYLEQTDDNIKKIIDV